MEKVTFGLRFRLLLLVVLAAAPPLALMLHSAWEDRQRQTAGWRQRSMEMVRVATRQEEDLISDAHQLLLAVAEYCQLRSGDPDGCAAFLRELLADDPRYANLVVVKTNGDVWVSAVPLAGPVNVADRQFLRRALQRHAFAIGDYQVGRITGKPTVNLGLPVLDRAGRVQMVCSAALDLEWFNRFDPEYQAALPPGATWTKIDSKGTILVHHPEPEKWLGKPLPDKALLKTVLSHRDGVAQGKDPEGVPCLYSFASTRSPLAVGHVVTILGVPKETLFADANRMLRRSLSWLGLAAGLALVIGWAGSSLLVLRRVNALVKSTSRLGSGDLRARTGLPHRNDELGQLARAFDQMAQSLEQRESERQHAEETLQTREEMMRELPLLPAGVYVCDAAGVIEIYNRTAVEVWGYEPDDHYTSKRFCGSHRLYRPDGTLLPHDESPTAEVLRTGFSVRNRELVVERPDGSRVTVLVGAVPMKDGDGQIIGATTCLQDITERKLAEEKLKEYSHNLQVLSRRLVEAQETERRHIARELHDEIGQALTVVEMNFQAALRAPGAAALAPRLKEGLGVVERVLEQVRDLSLNLRPSMLDDLGLEPALRWYTHRQATLAGLKAEFKPAPLEERLDPMVETECFRVAQEALTNVVRHARARTVKVELRKEDSRLHLSVRDDGVGFNVTAVRDKAVGGASLGLLSMEERASLAAGGLECKSAPGQGTEVHAWFPLKRPAPPS
jgi:PAS domain S-box-containing protein